MTAIRTFRIVAFGDSMTLCRAQAPAMRWPALLQARLNRTFQNRRFEVINAGVGGNTSREGLARLGPDVLAHRPNLTLVEFGGNDAVADPGRAVGFAEYDRNLGEIAGRLRAAGSAIAWLSFLPIVDLWHHSGNPANRDAVEKYRPLGGLNQFLHEYRRRTRRFAERHQDLLIDLYAGVRDVLDQDHAARFILPDGVHFTDLGARLAADIVFNGLVRKSGKTVTFRFR